MPLLIVADIGGLSTFELMIGENLNIGSAYRDADRVLLVDGADQQSQLMKLSLEHEGYTVDSVTAVKDALRLPLGSYVLFIVDMKMDNMGGLDFARDLRNHPSTIATPLIICSTRDNDRDIVDGLDAGADDYISRAISIPTFLARVRSLMRRHYTCKRSV